MLLFYSGCDSAGPVSTLVPSSLWPQNGSRIEVPRLESHQNNVHSKTDIAGGVPGPELKHKTVDFVPPKAQPPLQSCWCHVAAAAF
jgi:hypothetical protein